MMNFTLFRNNFLLGTFNRSALVAHWDHRRVGDVIWDKAFNKFHVLGPRGSWQLLHENKVPPEIKAQVVLMI